MTLEATLLFMFLEQYARNESSIMETTGVRKIQEGLDYEKGVHKKNNRNCSGVGHGNGAERLF